MRRSLATLCLLLPLFCVAADDEPSPAGLGSGFSIHPDGWLLTAAHVVVGCPRVHIAGLGESTTMAVDRELDIALLKGPGSIQHWFALNPTASIGDAVTVSRLQAAGTRWQRASPLTAKVTATRRHDGDRRYLQFDASLRAGESGAPVVDEQGRVVGLVVARLTPGAAYRLTGNPRQAVAYAVNAVALLQFVTPWVHDIASIEPTANSAGLGQGQWVVECWAE